MKTSELDYHLPSELIAQYPTSQRSDSRLLRVDRSSGVLTDLAFNRLTEQLQPGDCLVLNDTKVLPARFFGRRQTGARLEGLFLRSVGQNLWEVLLKGSRKIKVRETFLLETRDRTGTLEAGMVERFEEGRCHIQIACDKPAETLLEAIGFPPLPPYIHRNGDLNRADEDRRRYQTVYAQQAGAVAAPTAGLHFTPELLQTLRAQGIKLARLTLHVGMGTFKPVTAEHLADHPIHSERVVISQETAQIVNQARQQGGRVIAVGTTSTRALESAARCHDNRWSLAPFCGSTDLFILPGYDFKLIDGLITNFHLPKSTLLALVGAFTGMDLMRRTYAHAVRQRYRFYSYGDAMLIM